MDVGAAEARFLGPLLLARRSVSGDSDVKGVCSTSDSSGSVLNVIDSSSARLLGRLIDSYSGRAELW